jgi:hypothetical protein
MLRGIFTFSEKYEGMSEIGFFRFDFKVHYLQ